MPIANNSQQILSHPGKISIGETIFLIDIHNFYLGFITSQF